MDRRNLTAEERFVSSILQGLWLIISWPFRKLKIKNEKLKIGGAIDREKIQAKWQEIEELMKLGGESRFKQAVIEADKLVGYILDSKARLGHTFADQLRHLEDQIDPKIYQDLWEAHKLRNIVAHEIEYEVLVYEARDAVAKVRSALKYWGLI